MRLERSDPSRWLTLSGTLLLREAESVDFTKGGEIVESSRRVLTATGIAASAFLGNNAAALTASSPLAALSSLSVPSYYTQEGAAREAAKGRGGEGAIVNAAMARQAQRKAKMEAMIARQRQRTPTAASPQTSSPSASASSSSSSSPPPFQTPSPTLATASPIAIPPPLEGDLLITLLRNTTDSAIAHDGLMSASFHMRRVSRGGDASEMKGARLGDVRVSVRGRGGRWLPVGGLASAVGRTDLGFSDPSAGNAILSGLASYLAARATAAQQHHAVMGAYRAALAATDEAGVGGEAAPSLPPPPDLGILLLPATKEEREFWFGDRVEAASNQYNVFN